MKHRLNHLALAAIATIAVIGMPTITMAAQMNGAEADAVKNMAQANMAEVATGQLALQKSKDAQVRQFAQKMVDDHSAALKDVQQLAQLKGVTLPKNLDQKHKADFAKLDAADGAVFDRQYMSAAGIEDHQSVQMMLQETQRDSMDADRKTLAGKMLPVVHSHLMNAEQIGTSK